MTSNVRAGGIEELIKPGRDTTNPDSPPWVIIDLGFSGSSRSCGITINGSRIPDPLEGYRSSSSTAKTPGDKHYGMLCPAIVEWLSTRYSPEKPGAINLMIEAPLSMAFAKRSASGDRLRGAHQGNPIARIPDQLEGIDAYGRAQVQRRLWYTQPASGLMIGSIRLLQELATALDGWDIRLFEGFVSFKNGDEPGSHWRDTLELWRGLPESPNPFEPLINPIVDSQVGKVESILGLANMGPSSDIPPILRVTGAPDNRVTERYAARRN
ncbi:hypothetical protein [Spiribacter pallidus]|uniref:Carbohydrate kinase FGGY N-terminal domain-containing protein n=1 Tax=Spiribacter pallidus TaxID=1987936 RepID=A0ABV3TCT0_9GAMM